MANFKDGEEATDTATPSDNVAFSHASLTDEVITAMARARHGAIDEVGAANLQAEIYCLRNMPNERDSEVRHG